MNQEVMAQLKALYPDVELPKRDNSDMHELIARNTVSQPTSNPHFSSRNALKFADMAVLVLPDQSTSLHPGCIMGLANSSHPQHSELHQPTRPIRGTSPHGSRASQLRENLLRHDDRQLGC